MTGHPLIAPHIQVFFQCWSMSLVLSFSEVSHLTSSLWTSEASAHIWFIYYTLLSAAALPRLCKITTSTARRRVSLGVERQRASAAALTSWPVSWDIKIPKVRSTGRANCFHILFHFHFKLQNKDLLVFVKALGIHPKENTKVLEDHQILLFHDSTETLPVTRTVQNQVPSSCLRRNKSLPSRVHQWNCTCWLKKKKFCFTLGGWRKCRKHTIK